MRKIRKITFDYIHKDRLDFMEDLRQKLLNEISHPIWMDINHEHIMSTDHIEIGDNKWSIVFGTEEDPIVYVYYSIYETDEPEEKIIVEWYCDRMIQRKSVNELMTNQLKKNKSL